MAQQGFSSVWHSGRLSLFCKPSQAQPAVQCGSPAATALTCSLGTWSKEVFCVLSIAPKQSFPLRPTLGECFARFAPSGQSRARLCLRSPSVQPLSASRRFAAAWFFGRLRLNPNGPLPNKLFKPDWLRQPA